MAKTTGATIVRYAKRDGWTPPVGWRRPRIDFTDVRERGEVQRANGALHFYYPGDLRHIPTATYLVKRWLFRNQLSVIYGPPGAGKTFFALDLALRIALGRQWFGHKVKQGGVIYVMLEGITGGRNRFDAWCKYHNIEDKESVPIVFVEGALDLRTSSRQLLTQIAQEVERASTRFGLPVQIIFVDTLARAMSGGDENSSQDMGALIAGADAVRNLTKAHVCLVHHEGKESAKGMRGHSSLLGAADTTIAIGKDPKCSVARLTKQKEDEGGKRQRFTLASVALDRHDEDGEPVTSAVVVPAGASPVFEDERLNQRQRDALQALHELLHDQFADVDDDDVAQRWTTAARWRAALETAGWPDTGRRRSKGDRISGGRTARREATGSGFKADTARTRESFEREFRRLRQDLKEKGILELDGEKVAFTKGQADNGGQ